MKKIDKNSKEYLQFQRDIKRLENRLSRQKKLKEEKDPSKYTIEFSTAIQDERGLVIIMKKKSRETNDSTNIIFYTVFEGPDGVMMVEKYLNDKEAKKWLEGLEKRNVISSAKAYKRKMK